MKEAYEQPTRNERPTAGNDNLAFPAIMEDVPKSLMQRIKDDVKSGADKVLDKSFDIGQKLEIKAVKEVEKKVGKSFITKALDKTREKRYKIAEDLIKTAGDATLNAVEKGLENKLFNRK